MPPSQITFAQLCSFLVCCTIFRISSSLMFAAKSSTMFFSSVRVLGSNLITCAIAWDQNEKSRGGKSGEYCRSSDELSFVKLFSCQILQEENPQALCRYVEAGTVLLGPILSSCCQVLHLLPDSIFEDLFVLGIRLNFLIPGTKPKAHSICRQGQVVEELILL